MTVSCARCHNHKFDAISQADYYALFGVLASCRPSLRDVNVEAKQQQNVAEISELKTEIRAEVAKSWLASIDEVRQKLLSDNWEEKVANHKNANQLFYLLSESRRQKRKESPSKKRGKSSRMIGSDCMRAWPTTGNEETHGIGTWLILMTLKHGTEMETAYPNPRSQPAISISSRPNA